MGLTADYSYREGDAPAITSTISWCTTMKFEIADRAAASQMMSILVENGYEVSFKEVTKKKKTVYVISVTQTGRN